jgi:hypothetical protein
VPDVLGPVDAAAWTGVLTSKCGVSTTTIDATEGVFPTDQFNDAPLLMKITFPTPSGADSLAQNEIYLASLIDHLPKHNYTVLYTTSRASDVMFRAQNVESVIYDMDSQIQENLHLDLKRDLGARIENTKAKDNQTMIDGPLFDKYQFLSPGESQDGSLESSESASL